MCIRDRAAGLDLQANIKEAIVLKPLERQLIPTGIHLALPEGFEAQVRPRSGLAFKYGLGVINSPGTIDADYRGDVGVLLVNLSNVSQEIKPGERIAQLVISEFTRIEWKATEQLTETKRGAGGFGSTGK